MVKKISIFVVFVLVAMTGFVFAAQVARQPTAVTRPKASNKVVLNVVPRLTVVAPKVGDDFSGAGAISIKWTYSGNVGATVKIELLNGGNPVETIAVNAPAGANGTGGYSWTVPNNLATDSDYQIRITSQADSKCTVTGGKFSIHNSGDRGKLMELGGGTWATGSKMESNSGQVAGVSIKGNIVALPVQITTDKIVAVGKPSGSLQLTTSQIVAVGKSTDTLQITTDKIVAVGKSVNTTNPGVTEINTASIIGIGKQVESVEITTDKIMAVGK